MNRAEWLAERVDRYTAEASDRFTDWSLGKATTALVIAIAGLAVVTIVAQFGMKVGWW